MNEILLAVPGDPGRGVDTFWGTQAGTILGMVMGIIGLLVVLMAVVKAFSHVSQGKIGNAVKVVLGAGVLAVFLFQPELITAVINMLGKAVSAVINSGSEIVDQGSQNGGSGQ